MAQRIGEVIARFEVARRKLDTALAQSDMDGGNLVVTVDREVSEVFSQILDADLCCQDERAHRIEFLLNEIIAASDRDSFICTLAERAIADMKQAISPDDQLDSTLPATG